VTPRNDGSDRVGRERHTMILAIAWMYRVRIPQIPWWLALVVGPGAAAATLIVPWAIRHWERRRRG
jgi:hypothetical protein